MANIFTPTQYIIRTLFLVTSHSGYILSIVKLQTCSGDHFVYSRVQPCLVQVRLFLFRVFVLLRRRIQWVSSKNPFHMQHLFLLLLVLSKAHTRHILSEGVIHVSSKMTLDGFICQRLIHTTTIVVSKLAFL